MSRVVHFEIPADDPEKAVEFYKNVFDWTFSRWGQEEYWLAMTGPKDHPGIDGAITKKSDTIKGVRNTIGVASVDESAEKIKAAGGELLMPKSAIPTVGWLIYFRDPAGNVFGAMQDDPEAK